MTYLTASEFEKVGQLAAHCDNKKLAIAIEETVRFEMRRIFCDLWEDIEANWGATEGVWYDLINGSTYEGCNGKTRYQYGIKNALIYYSYARYVVLNGFNDTPSGHVQKTNQFSMPKPLKELHQFSDKYRNMGKYTVEGIENFLCRADEASYPNFSRSICRACGCAGECGNNTHTKGYGIKSKNVSKWGV